MTHGEPGEVYNVASSRVITIRDILDTLVSLSSVDIQVEVDPDRFRPNSQPRTWGDASRLRGVSGWHPEYDLKQTLRDVLNECRARVRVIG
jgi:GDP-4-dehydro-6-deoxy-D-mannose reductase